MMRVFFFLFALTIAVVGATAQDVKTVLLKQQRVNFAPRGFYVSDVVDDRADNSIGTMSEGGGSMKLTLEGGAAAAIKGFVEHNVSQNKASQAIALHITKMDFTVRKAGATSRVDGQTALSFYVGDTKVAEYSGKGGGGIGTDPADFIEGFIRKAIEDDLREFDKAWKQEKDQVVTSDAVHVNVTMGRTEDNGNLIVYSLQRPLRIADFEGPVTGQADELAVTNSGIEMSYGVKTENGQLVVDIVVTPIFDRKGSWFKEEGKNPYVLGHEQAHFDIAALKACELAETIRKTAFTQKNYQAVLDQLRKQNLEDERAEETTYDLETNHSIITDKQIEWQNRLKQQLRDSGCY